MVKIEDVLIEDIGGKEYFSNYIYTSVTVFKFACQVRSTCSQISISGLPMVKHQTHTCTHAHTHTHTLAHTHAHTVELSIQMEYS